MKTPFIKGLIGLTQPTGKNSSVHLSPFTAENSCSRACANALAIIMAIMLLHPGG